MSKDELSTAQSTALSHIGCADEGKFEAGDVILEEIGEFTTRDGRKVFGVLLTAPAEPPPLKLNHVWERTPFQLVERSSLHREAIAEKPSFEGVIPISKSEHAALLECAKALGSMITAHSADEMSSATLAADSALSSLRKARGTE
jgi:hypothetical protein